jgi:hypothetical protein
MLATSAAGAASGESLVAVGDIANPPGGGRGDVTTARLIQQNQPTAVLALGDTQYEHGEYENFLRAYDRSWGQFRQLTRPAVGNHEYMDPAGPAAGYFRYFGRRAGDPSKGYYSFDIGPWHAVALNSNCGAAGTMGDVDYAAAPWTVIAGTGGRSLIPFSSVHPNSSARAQVDGVYKMVLYPDRWIGAHKGADGVTRDLRSIGCH